MFARPKKAACCLLAAAFCLLPAACCLLLSVGCSCRPPNGEEPAGKAPLAATKLRLLVAGDSDLATAIGQLRGEWNGQTGCELELQQITAAELADAEKIEADAIICPSCSFGVLAQRKLTWGVPQSVQQDERGDWSEVFELLRWAEVAWGTEIQGVPFGSPVLTCYCRADLLDKLDRRPPETWSEYHELATLLGNLKNHGSAAPDDSAAPDHKAQWYGAIEPLGPGWAGIVLLARAAPYAKHHDQYSTLFNIATMEPLLEGPPLVRALEELLAVARHGPPEQLQYDPAAVRKAFWEGRCGLALSWPTAADKVPAAVDPALRVGFAELPGSREVFNIRQQAWETDRRDEDVHVPLLGVAGRIGVVTTSSTHPEAALQLLLWLSGRQYSPQVSVASAATTLFRRSHASSPGAWVENPVPAAAAAEYAEVTRQTLSRKQWLFALRIPGRTEYLAALDEAVHGAIGGQLSPQEALRQAAERWRKITQKLGLQRQRDAYRHSLGLD